MSISIHHKVKLYAQPTNMTCWSAAATMMFGTNASYGPGAGRLGVSGGLVPSSVPAFASSLGLTVEYPQSWSVEGLAGLLRTGPLWVGGAVPTLHAFVIGGIVSDGSPDKTILTIYDPWPPGRGAVRQVAYGDLMRDYPLATMYVLHHRVGHARGRH